MRHHREEAALRAVGGLRLVARARQRRDVAADELPVAVAELFDRAPSSRATSAASSRLRRAISASAPHATISSAPASVAANGIAQSGSEASGIGEEKCQHDDRAARRERQQAVAEHGPRAHVIPRCRVGAIDA